MSQNLLKLQLQDITHKSDITKLLTRVFKSVLKQKISKTHTLKKRREDEVESAGSYCVTKSYLGAFTKLRKATISHVVSVRMELGSHWTDFDKI
jgi:hypothetical protein